MLENVENELSQSVVTGKRGSERNGEDEQGTREARATACEQVPFQFPRSDTATTTERQQQEGGGAQGKGKNDTTIIP